MTPENVSQRTKAVSGSFAGATLPCRSGRTRGIMRIAVAVVLVAGAVSLTACSAGDETPLSDAASRGRRVYLHVCTACHAADPAFEGSQGPPLAGSSRELLESRLLRGEYPPGYTPKRPSAVMPRFENLAGSIDDLAAWLNASEQD